MEAMLLSNQAIFKHAMPNDTPGILLSIARQSSAVFSRLQPRSLRSTADTFRAAAFSKS